LVSSIIHIKDARSNAYQSPTPSSRSYRTELRLYIKLKRRFLLYELIKFSRPEERQLVRPKHVSFFNYSCTPLIRTLVIENANYPDRLGPSGKPYLTVTVIHISGLKFLSQLSNKYKELCINVSFVRK